MHPSWNWIGACGSERWLLWTTRLEPLLSRRRWSADSPSSECRAASFPQGLDARPRTRCTLGQSCCEACDQIASVLRTQQLAQPKLRPSFLLLEGPGVREGDRGRGTARPMQLRRQSRSPHAPGECATRVCNSRKWRPPPALRHSQVCPTTVVDNRNRLCTPWTSARCQCQSHW